MPFVSPVIPVTTSPAGVPGSTSLNAVPMIWATVVPVGPVESSATGEIVPAPLLASTGAVFETTAEAVAVAIAELKAELPPAVLASTAEPTVPLVWSHPRYEMFAVPAAEPTVGTNRTRS